MPLQLWKNPEFIRHCRSELRRSRAKTVGLVVLLLCALTILACWADQESRLVALQYSLSAQKNVSSASQEYVRKFAENLPKNTAHNAYEWLMLMQFGVISFWSLLSGAQAVSRERERGTWDFQRITRLTPAELLAWK